MVRGSLAGACAKIGQFCATPLPLPDVGVTEPKVITLSPGNRSPSATNNAAATFGLSASACRLRCTTIAPCEYPASTTLLAGRGWGKDCNCAPSAAVPASPLLMNPTQPSRSPSAGTAFAG